MSFVKSNQALKSQGISQRTNRKRFDFLNKKKDRFYIRVIPNDIEGYSATAIPYHRHLATVNIRNIHNGNNYPLEVNAKCLGDINECAGCRAAKRQYEEIPYESRKQDFYKIDKGRSIGQFFLVYEVYLNEDGSFSYGKESAPQIVEYNYRRGVCEDWDQFVDAYQEAAKTGVDPTDPKGGLVFRVERKKMPAARGNAMKTVYFHSNTGKGLALPEGWDSTLKSYDKLDERYLSFTADDLAVIVDTEEATQGIVNDRSITADERAVAMQAVYENYKTVTNSDFTNILEFLEKKEDKKDQASGGAQQGGEQRGWNNYSAAANQPMPEPRQPQAQAPAPQAHAATSEAFPAAQPKNLGQEMMSTGMPMPTGMPAPMAPMAAQPAAPVAIQPASTDGAKSALERVRALRANMKKAE